MIDCQARVSNSAGSLAALLDEMKTARVSRAVLFGVNAAVTPADLAEIRETDPGVFAAVGRLDPRSASALSECERLCSAGGLNGVDLCVEEPPGTRWVNLPEIMPVWERLARLRIPVSLCIASQDYNQFSDVVTSFPDLTVVLHDFGRGPGTDLAQFLPVVLEYARYPRVIVNMSGLFRMTAEAHPHRGLWRMMGEVWERFGPDRLVWGSGYPEVLSACGYQAEARLLEQLPFLNRVDIETITERTPSRLWFADRA